MSVDHGRVSVNLWGNMSIEVRKNWKGIVLAGGAGTRLHPLTQVSSKQLLPVYNKPMIYYPLSILMLGGIQDILLISTPEDLPRFKDLLGDGSDYGIRLTYAEQAKPEGIAQAFLIGADFIGDDNVCLILGDNLFYGDMLHIREGLDRESGGTVFGYQVHDPERYGVVEFDAEGKAISIEEKPEKPKSHYAVPGLYCYDNQVVDIVRALEPSARGEYEITDVNLAYLAKGDLHVKVLGRGMAWLDTGTHKSLLEASNFVSAVENTQGLMIACLEEIALEAGYITADQVRASMQKIKNSEYARYVLSLLDQMETGTST